MMDYLFPSGKSTEFSFKVGIAGTSTTPQSVLLTLEKAATILSYSASKVGDDWVAVIDNPGKMFGVGPVKLSVNVVLNNRIFTPMKAEAIIYEDSEEEVETRSQSTDAEKDAATELSFNNDISPEPKKVEIVDPETVTPEKRQISVEVIKSILGDVKTEVVNIKESKNINILKSIEPEQINVDIEKVITENVLKPVVKTTSKFSLKRTKVVTK